MEKIVSNKDWNKGISLNDPTLRFPSRPGTTLSKPTDLPSTPRRRGVAHEDFGSSFGKVPSTSQEKPAPKPDRHPGTSSKNVADTSIDELDTLTRQSSGISTKDEEIEVSGKTDMSHLAKIQRPSILPSLKFRKNNGSSNQSDAGSTQSSNHPAPKDDHQKQERMKEDHISNTRPAPSTTFRKEKEPPRDVIVQKPRPKPRPIGAQNSSPHRPKSPGSSTRHRTIYDQNVSPVAKKTHSSAKELNSSERPPHLTVKKPKLAIFNSPVPVESSSRVSADSPTTLSSAESQTSDAKTRVKTPLDKAAKAQPANFPFPSPLNKGKVKTNAKKRRSARRIVSDSSDDCDEDRSSSAPTAQPFPMSTQMLNSIGSSPVVEPFNYDRMPSPGSPSRSQGKKRKESGSSMPGSEYEEENTILPCVDPRTLCPYCDAPLPPFPTRLLERLLASTKKKSHREPRPGNPLGRNAPFSVFITVCQRHRFESEILPEAERQGWPKSIDWDELRKRVYRMKGALRAVIDDAHTNDADGIGPRSRSVFWKEVMADVRKKGSRAAAGVSGQMASFEKAQPGYYGEMGSAIIHQILYDLFPPTSVDPDSVAPLTVNEFIQRILVPEVGLRLIMEDMKLDESESEDGIRILRESTNYGVAMFPADEREEGGSQTPGKVDVADRIVMERARKRRKELEADEKEEEEVEELVETKRKAPVKPASRSQARRPQPRLVSKKSDAENSQTSDDEASSVSSRKERGTRDRLPRGIRNFAGTIEIEATPRKHRTEKASADIVVTSSEDSTSGWDTGRMRKEHRKRSDKMPVKVSADADHPSLLSGTPTRPDLRGSTRADAEATPKPRIQPAPFSITPPLLKAQKMAKRKSRRGATSDRDSSWLLSDETHSSLGSDYDEG